MNANVAVPEGFGFHACRSGASRSQLNRYSVRHISLTTRKHVARYWAELVRDDVYGFAHIITLDWKLIQGDGLPLMPFDFPMAWFDEHEIACLKTIKPILRYILKIERLPNSYAAREEIIRTRPGYRPVPKQNHRGIVYRVPTKCRA